MLYLVEQRRSRPLRLDEYQERARLADQNRRVGAQGLRVPLLGLFGEVGSLLTIPKRIQREEPTYANYRDSITEEFGDVLWYLSNLASRHRIALSALAQARGQAETLSVPNKPNPFLTFDRLGRQRSSQSKDTTRIVEADYFALGGAVGRLMNEYAAGEHWELDRGEFLRHLARTFRLLVRAASNERIGLKFVALNNLAKIESRWPQRRSYRRLLDEDYDPSEQIPRRIEMYFVERRVKEKVYVFQTCRGINIGDRLTDNKTEKDDYRFHDVFHLSYAAVLGWSPVIRALFRVKRKSNASVDENEDGARAILIEEGIATWIFNHALNHEYFRKTKKLDYSLLKAIRLFVSGYEVEDSPLWQWERAILEGFKVFRMLRSRRKGWVIADLNRRSISFRTTPPRVNR